MSQDPPTPSGAPSAGWYEINIDGHLSGRWVAWFDGLTLTHLGDGTTLIAGPVVDQSALHGLLQKVRDLGLPLISVSPVEGDRPTTTTSSHIDASTTKEPS